MAHQQISVCPACGTELFADVLVYVGDPIHRTVPVYLIDVAVDEHANIVRWSYQGGSLERAMDFTAEKFEQTTDPMLYCHEYHDVRALVLDRTHRGMQHAADPRVAQHASVRRAGALPTGRQ